jgi:hypothetical protein
LQLANKKRLQPGSDELAKLKAEFRRLTDLWTQRHSNLLTTMKASIADSMAIQFKEENCFDLYNAIIKCASTSMFTQELKRNNLQSIKMKQMENFEEYFTRILWAKYELEFSGELVSKHLEFKLVLNGLPTTTPRDFSPITAQYNILPK